MDRLKSMFRAKPVYEPIHSDNDYEDEYDEAQGDRDEDYDGSTQENGDEGRPFSWIEYSVFLLLGVAMLWAWNMFLAAAPYFQHRFKSSVWILKNFQSAEISISTIANLGSMIALTKLQKNASYPHRITASLIINTVVFLLLALSTLIKTSAAVYFAFLMLTVFVASVSTGLIQNGLFAYTSGFGRSEYTQAIMTGQAIAGVLPPLAQIVAVAAVPTKQAGDDKDPSESPTSAFIYFLTATGVSVLAFVAFFYLLRRQHILSHAKTTLNSANKTTTNHTSEASPLTRPTEEGEKKSIPLTTLFLKLRLLCIAVFLCFAITMSFPVFTQAILSTRQPSPIPPPIFIPLAFLLWNLGDLLGRLATLIPTIRLTHYPFALLCLAMARLLFIPLYFLCNIGGRGATIPSDVFYLSVVQGGFGLTNGYLGSMCMMGTNEWVAEDEREAAGGFMGLCLVAGLTVGSLLSFVLGNKI